MPKLIKISKGIKIIGKSLTWKSEEGLDPLIFTPWSSKRFHKYVQQLIKSRLWN